MCGRLRLGKLTMTTSSSTSAARRHFRLLDATSSPSASHLVDDMAVVCSSPVATRAIGGRGGGSGSGRYDLLDGATSSPTTAFKHDDFPAELCDTSFGSSMSLGSSFELNRLAAAKVFGEDVPSVPSLVATNSGTDTVAGEVPRRPRSSTIGRCSTSGSSSGLLRRSPPRGPGHDGLGAAMGTILNSKSPGLAAKMSSPQYMDMSPLPPSSRGAAIVMEGTPLKPRRSGSRHSSDCSEALPPGSAMKEDLPSEAPTAEHAFTFRMTSGDEKPSRVGGGSLGRLFGTELSSQLQFRKHNTIGASSGASTSENRSTLDCVFGRDSAPTTTTGASAKAFGDHLGDHSFGSPENQPPAKRRPASLPLSNGNALVRNGPRSAGMGPPSNVPRPRPSLLKSMTTSAVVPLANKCGPEDMSLSSSDAGDVSIDASPSVQRSRLAVASASSHTTTTIRLPPGFDASGSPIAPGVRKSSRPGLFRQRSKDDSSPLGYGKRFAAAQEGESVLPTVYDEECGSPRPTLRVTAPVSGEAEHLPGFGASEREGKILPCFNVKDDGLMRITGDTLCDILSGAYDDRVESYQIVDCRFGYEFDGGHIRGAINLPTLDKVKRQFLPSTSLQAPLSSDDGDVSLPAPITRPPLRSQSGKPDANGTVRKRVLIFHCEFSLKRGPSSALALRQADRALAHDYPSCHYPELYVLQGGYAGFFRRFQQRCEPQAYIAMDDPMFHERRSIELNGFRKQFSRHRSFTYGDTRQTRSDGMLMSTQQQHTNRAPPNQQARNAAADGYNHSALSRVMHDGDSGSYDSSSGSPCTTQADALHVRRRGMARAATTINALNSAPAYALGGGGGSAALRLGSKPVLRQRDESNDEPAATCVGDLSFDSSCSIVGEDDTSASFDAGHGDSPCAAAGGSQSRRLPALAPGPSFRFVVGNDAQGVSGSQCRATRPQ